MIKPTLTRRDFLKLVSTLTLAPLASRLPVRLLSNPASGSARPNIIVILFDAMSANHLSFYGYPRKTSPNLEAFASRANVYYKHHSAGTYTTTSSASLYTGTYPWTHRALNFGSQVLQKLADRNLFRLLHGTYQQLAFTQNLFADTLLFQFQQNIDQHIRLDDFTSTGHVLFNKLFPQDAYYGTKSFDQFLFKTGQVHGSLFLSLLNDLRGLIESRTSAEEMSESYPDGLPNLPALDHTYFSLDQVIDGVIDLAGTLTPPSFAYFHLLSPHDPYKPTRPYLNLFNDQWIPPVKPVHGLSDGIPEDQLNRARLTYDQYVANTDAEFGRLVDSLEKNGLLDTSYVIVTSDHGELFERGVIGHGGPFAYEDHIHIPLLISIPRQHTHQEIFAPTTNIDLLPTILHLSDLPIPDWAEGRVLPGLGVQENSERSIFVVDAKENSRFKPLRVGTLALIKGGYKLIHYMGYRDQYQDDYEFYDLENDPQELQNLYDTSPTAKDFQNELLAKLEEVNQPYS